MVKTQTVLNSREYILSVICFIVMFASLGFFSATIFIIYPELPEDKKKGTNKSLYHSTIAIISVFGIAIVYLTWKHFQHSGKLLQKPQPNNTDAPPTN